MEMQNYENCDDRKKNYDISPLHFNKIMLEIAELRSRSLLFDIVIKSGDRRFHAHKIILAASSDYFRAMFTKEGMLESDQHTININGISAIGIENVLNFIYTAKLCLTISNVQEVLAAANYFQLSTIVDACLNFLEGELDTENCIDMLIISENYSLTPLREKVLRFICSHVSEIAKGEEFWRLQESQIEQLLSSDLPVDCCEAEILKIALRWVLKYDAKSPEHLLRNINFKEIPVIEVEKVMKSLEVKRTDALYTAVWSLTVPQTNSKTSNDNKLLNHRGMELALIKIGGFEMTGITNEITYSFPSTSNPPIINEAWRYLTEIPHIKQGSYGTAVLNNFIFIVGGSYDINLDNEDVHPFGFKYNPLTSEWNTIKPMNFDRCRFSLNVLESSLIAVGGENSEGLFQRLDDGNHEAQNVATVERYDVNADSWTILSSMPEYRSQHAGATYDNHLYISGGIDQYGNVLDSFYDYDVGTDKWMKICHLTPRADHVMLRIDKKIFICGGWEEVNGQRRLISAIECFDVRNSTINIITYVPTPRFHAGIALINNKIWIIGGFSADDIFRHTATKIEVYDIAEDKWFFPEKYPKHIWEHNLTSIYIPKENGLIL